MTDDRAALVDKVAMAMWEANQYDASQAKPSPASPSTSSAPRHWRKPREWRMKRKMTGRYNGARASKLTAI